MQNRWLVPSVVFAGLVAGAAAWFLVPRAEDLAVETPQVASLDRAPATPVAAPSNRSDRKAERREERREDRRTERADRRDERKADRKAELQARRTAEREARQLERDPEFEGEERAQMRYAYRDEALADVHGRLDAHAETMGWDWETTEAVRDILSQTSDQITDVLTRVDRGDARWENVKDEVRQYRIDQAQAVEAELGPDGFEDFVDGMGFERFYGDQPVWGRLPE